MVVYAILFSYYFSRWILKEIQWHIHIYFSYFSTESLEEFMKVLGINWCDLIYWMSFRWCLFVAPFPYAYIEALLV